MKKNKGKSSGGGSIKGSSSGGSTRKPQWGWFILMSEWDQEMESLTVIDADQTQSTWIIQCHGSLVQPINESRQRYIKTYVWCNQRQSATQLDYMEGIKGLWYNKSSS
jgi:hypothetical protein